MLGTRASEDADRSSGIGQRRPSPSFGPRGGGVYLSRVQQTRLLDAALEVVAGEGVRRLTVTRVSARAGVSSKTFYDLFADGEDCFLGVFDRAVDELAAVLAPVWKREAGEDGWVERVRSALVALLGALERDPAVARVVVVEALGGGPRVLARRVEVLERVAGFLDEGRVGAPAGLPSLVAPGVAGAAFSVVHSSLLEEPPKSLMELVGPVMATVVLPYRGREVSARELARPVPEFPVGGEPSGDDLTVSQERGDSENDSSVSQARGANRSNALSPSVRPTERTLMVLASVGERGGANNRGVAAGADIHDDAQISRLLARLAEHGLVENRAAGRRRSAKAWWLTASGAEFLRKGPALAGAAPTTVNTGRSRGGKSSSARAGHSGGRGAGRGAPAGSLDVAECQRVRILRAAAAVVDERGYGAVTVSHITARAKVSRRTFYELFVDREQCLLAVMGDIERQLASELEAAELGGLQWRERVRIGLWTVLRFFDREPVLARFCVVESARGDEQMASYRAELLERIVAVLAEGGRQRSSLGESSALTAEGIAGAVVSILATHLSASSGAGPRDTQSVASLHGGLMALIVLPYFGFEAARLEQERPAPAGAMPGGLWVPAAGSERGGRRLEFDAGRSRVPGLRMTYRTALVLEGIAQRPGISNLDVARHAQVNDQGQISKLLSRLQRHGLVLNTGGGQGQGAPNEWRLTPAGRQLQQQIRDRAREHENQAA